MFILRLFFFEHVATISFVDTYRMRSIKLCFLSFKYCNKIIVLTSTSFGSATTTFNSGPSQTRIKSPYCLISLTIILKLSGEGNRQYNYHLLIEKNRQYFDNKFYVDFFFKLFIT